MEALTISRADAEALGLRPLTVPYAPEELHMAQAALRSLLAGNIPAALVEVKGGVEVWRGMDGMRDRGDRA